MSGNAAPSLSSVCSIVVLYFPDETVIDNVKAISAQCDCVIIADNGSTPQMREQLGEVKGVLFLVLGSNLGVAAALNRGMEEAVRRGFQWVVTFDQDSYPEPGMIAALWSAHSNYPNASILAPCAAEEAIGSKSARWVQRHPRWPFAFRRSQCSNQDLRDVTMVVTSGALTEISAWHEHGGFDDGLFIDYVDIDFCLKLLEADREIVVVANAVLLHHLGGRRSVRVLGNDFRPMFHAPFRHYYMSRNRIFMWSRHASRNPHWAFFDFLFAIYNFCRVVAFEDKKLAKIGFMIRGVWDGARGGKGPLKTSHR